MYTRSEYEEYFKDCQKALDLAKTIMSREEIKPIKPSPVIKEARGEWCRFFSRSEFYQVCYQCGGVCCRTYNFILRPIELLYFVVENPQFDFPEPDWRFLKGGERINNRIKGLDNLCLFLSNKGCLLGEYRPEICLTFHDCDFQGHLFQRKVKEFCPELEKEKLFFILKSRYCKAIKSFCEEILRTVGVSREGEHLLNYLETEANLIGGFADSETCLNIFEKLANKEPA